MKEIFELAILLSLKDAASGRLDTAEAKLRSLGKEGRATLKTFDDLRRDLRQGLVLGGVGVTGLAMLKGGITSAGDFESAITELRLSVEEAGQGGALNLAKLNDQMNRFEQLGVKLGNQLPGTTKDFIDMFVALKQGGLQTETILKGAGESVAYLAVLSNSVPKELAKDFAMIGEQFQLKPEEFAPATDLFLKNFRAIGLRPEQMIEGTKFAQLRGGLPLGLKGLGGLSTMSSLLGLLKVMGLEGGIGGREIAGMLMGLDAHSKEQKKADAQLRKMGVNLQFFDKKGAFLGVENVINQLQKLRPLSQQQRLDVVEKRFGSKEVMGPVAAIIEQGAEGYDKLKTRMAAVPSLQNQINEKMATYNAKMEAVLGTIENLKATTFTPMLDSLKPALDLANQFIGSLQEFGKDHPGIAKLGTDLFAIGSASLVVVGGFKAMRAAWGLWKIASAVGSGEAGMLSFLRTARTETDATAATLGSSGTLSKWRGAGSKMGGALITGLKVTLAGFAIEALIQGILERGHAAAERGKAGEERKDLEKERTKILAEAGRTGNTADLAEKLADLDKRIGESRAAEVGATDVGRYGKFGRAEFSEALKTVSEGTLAAILKGHAGVMATESAAWASLNKLLTEVPFKSAPQLVGFLETIRKSGEYNKQDLDRLRALATALYPQYESELKKLSEETENAAENLSKLARWSPPGSAGSSKVDPHNKYRVWVPSKASGGTVMSEGLVYVHGREQIVPARVTDRYQSPRIEVIPGLPGRRGGSLGPTTIHIHSLNVHVPKGSRAAEDPGAFLKTVMEHVTHEVHLQRERR